MTETKPLTFREYQQQCLAWKIKRDLTWERASADLGIPKSTLQGWAEKHRPQIVEVRFNAP